MKIGTWMLLVLILIGMNGCAVFRKQDYTIPEAFRPVKNVPTVPPDETDLPYSTLPNGGEGSFV